MTEIVKLVDFARTTVDLAGASLRTTSLKGTPLSMSTRSQQKMAIRKVATCALDPDNIDVLVRVVGNPVGES